MPRPLPRPSMKQPPSPCRATPAAHIGHVSHPHDRAGTVPRDCRPARHATIDLASHPRRPRTTPTTPTKTTRMRRATTSEKRSPEEGVHGDRRLHTTSERRPSSTASQRHAGAKPPRHVPLLPQPIASPRLGLGVRRPQPPHHEREEMAGRGARGDRRLHRRTVEQCITLMRGLLGMRRIHRRTLKAVVAQNAHLGKAPHHRQDQGDVHRSQPGRSGEARAQSPARRLPPFIAASETSPPIEFLPTTTIALSRCAAACSEPTQLPSSARALSWYGSPPFQSFRSIGRDV
jgi:hypothetical protein